MNEQITIERPSQGSAAQSTLKSVLLYVHNSSALDDQLQAALGIVRAAGGHLGCLHVTPVQAYVAFDNFGGVFVMPDVIDKLEEQDAALRSKAEGRLQKEDVSWDYEQITGDVIAQIVSRASLSDLIVFGREPQRYDFAGPSLSVIGDLLHRSETPLFIPGDAPAPVDITGTAVIAWDGSIEAANAVRASVGLLKLASAIEVIHVAEDKPEQFPGTRLLEYLSRHDLHANMTVQDPPTADGDAAVIAATIVSFARGIDAAYIVMGGYSHNRIREWVFGGVTRALLKACPLPLVVTH